MKISELIGGKSTVQQADKFDLIDGFEIWTTNEEVNLLNKLKRPVRLSSLTEHEQFTVQAMIRKSLVTKIGHNDPTVVANEKK
jgi:hypothetical protein